MWQSDSTIRCKGTCAVFTLQKHTYQWDYNQLPIWTIVQNAKSTPNLSHVIMWIILQSSSSSPCSILTHLAEQYSELENKTAGCFQGYGSIKLSLCLEQHSRHVLFSLDIGKQQVETGHFGYAYDFFPTCICTISKRGKMFWIQWWSIFLHHIIHYIYIIFNAEILFFTVLALAIFYKVK